MLSRSMSRKPIRLEFPKKLVHALARRPNHRRQIALSQRRVQPDGPARQALAVFLGEPRQPRRKSSGEIQKWSSATCVVRRRNSPASEVSNASRMAGWLATRTRNWSRGKVRTSVGSSADRACGPRSAVEERQLAKEVAAPQCCQNGLVSFLGWNDDLYRARRDDEERVPWIALVEQHLAMPEASGPQPPCYRLQRLTVHPANRGHRPRDSAANSACNTPHIVAAS